MRIDTDVSAAVSTPLDIAIHTLGLRISGEDPLETSLGGSESAVVSIARALTSLGHRVSVLCRRGEPDRVSRVDYVPAEALPAFAAGRELDLFLSSRHHEVLDQTIEASMVGLWHHDTPIERAHQRWAKAISKSTFSLFVSRFQEAAYEREVPGLAAHGLLTSNGVDFDAIETVRTERPTGSRPLRFVYGSRPERGLDYLLTTIWPRIRARYPEAELRVSSYALEGLDLPPDLLEFYRHCDSLIRHTEGAVSLGHLCRGDFWREMVGARALLYPTRFPEVSCMVALEAQALGVPVVTTDDFALCETVASEDTRVERHPGSPRYADAFVETVFRLVEDETFYETAVARGRGHVNAESHSWAAIARSWLAFLETKFSERLEKNRPSVLRRLVRNGDLGAARRLVASSDAFALVRDTQSPKLAGIDDGIDLTESAVPLTGNEDVSQWFGSLTQLIEELAIAEDGTLEPTNLLDVGCLPAGIEARLAEGRPWLQVVRLEAKNLVHDASSALIGAKYDLVLVGPLLAAVEEPRELLEAVERSAQRGVLGCAPFGPWGAIERSFRGTHQLGYDELRDLLAKKRSLRLVFAPWGETPRHEPLGHWLFSYRHNPGENAAIGELDLDRKIRRARPLPKISAIVLAKNEEANLRRCIESFEAHVDESVIGDTGSTDQTVAIAQSMGFVVEPPRATDHPRRLVSIPFNDFAQARNALARHATGPDYLYWQDADEVLVGGDALRRFVDDNVFFDALQIEQRHVSVDSSLSPNAPIRCFRPDTEEGALGWVGSVHEHVEHLAQGPNRPPRRITPIVGVYVAHFGYWSQAIRTEKMSQRNLALLLADRETNPDRYAGYVLGMREYLNLARWEINEAGRVTRKAYRCLNLGFEVWDRHIKHFPRAYRDMGWDISREILSILARFELKLRATGRVPFHADFSLAARRGVLDVDSSRIPRKRTFYARVSELREELDEKFVSMDDDLGEPYASDLSPDAPAETDRYRRLDLPPALFGLEPFED